MGYWGGVLILIALFMVLQIQTLDYGTRINDQPHIRNYQSTAKVLDESVSTRNTVVGESKTRMHESLDRWMLRYKLYSIEADEMVNITALSRIKPGDLQFDPGFYQYGGAWLYPLGVWYYGLAKGGGVPLASLQELLIEPDKMDTIYFFGRLLVLITVSASALLLFAALKELTSPAAALFLTAVYLSTPALVGYSQIMKPHFYGLLWANAALLFIIQAVKRNNFPPMRQFLLGAALGLAVGSSPPFGLLAVFIWIVMLNRVFKAAFSWRVLFSVPLVAVVFWVLSNPYFFLNRGAAAEEASVLGSWFKVGFGGDVIAAFLKNSLLPGFGVGLSLTVLSAMLFSVFRRENAAQIFISAALVFVVVVVASITSGWMSHWHTNFRYATYLLPGMIILVALSPFSRSRVLLGALLVITVAQAVPMKLAYYDENDPSHSTRLLAMNWLHENLQKDEVICFGTETPAPYDVPPIDFTRYQISEAGCQYKIIVEREKLGRVPWGRWALVKRFAPRYSPPSFPLVFEHINPQISVYRRNG